MQNLRRSASAVRIASRGRARPSVDHADLLPAEPAPQDAAKALLEGRLVNVELVGIDLALHDGFAETVTARDEDHVAKSRFGIEREDDPAGREVRADHLHHGDGEGDLEVIEAVVDAIGNRAIGEDRGEAAPAGFEQIVRAPHVEEAFMLARETRGRQIFRRRRTSHGDGDAGPVLLLQLAISRGNLLAQLIAAGCGIDDSARLGCALRKRLDLALVETVEKPMKVAQRVGFGSASR